MTTGWECPVCKSVWAPSVLRCQNNHGAMGAPVPINPIYPPGTGPVSFDTSAIPDTATIISATLTAGYTVNALRPS